MALSRRRLLIAGLGARTAIGSAIAAEPTTGAVQSRLSTEALAGQMLMIGFSGDAPDAPGAEAVRRGIAAGRIGGVILFADNLPSPDAARRLTRAFHRAGRPGRRPLIAVDQEGGAVSRLRPERGFVALPSAREVAAGDGVGEAFARYTRTAQELARLGFTVNLGPVVDLDLDPGSRIISGLGRSFGSDPAEVGRYARAFVAAHHEVGVLTAAKHFPGHGSTAQDSHEALPDITAHWRPEELRPFADLVREGVPMIMLGHLVHAERTGPGVPASLSRTAVTDWLRGGLGFKGLAITDDLHMAAIRDNFGFDEAVLRAVEAGNDVLVFSNREHADPELPDRFTAAIIAAVASGRLGRERLLESHARRRAAEAGRRRAVGG